MESYLWVDLLGPGPRHMKKEFTVSRSRKDWETLVYNILYMRSFKWLSVHIGLNGYGKEIIILLVYRCICSFVGHLLRKPPSFSSCTWKYSIPCRFLSNFVLWRCTRVKWNIPTLVKISQKWHNVKMSLCISWV